MSLVWQILIDRNKHKYYQNGLALKRSPNRNTSLWKMPHVVDRLTVEEIFELQSRFCKTTSAFIYVSFTILNNIIKKLTKSLGCI